MQLELLEEMSEEQGVDLNGILTPDYCRDIGDNYVYSKHALCSALSNSEMPSVEELQLLQQLRRVNHAWSLVEVQRVLVKSFNKFVDSELALPSITKSKAHLASHKKLSLSRPSRTPRTPKSTTTSPSSSTSPITPKGGHSGSSPFFSASSSSSSSTTSSSPRSSGGESPLYAPNTPDSSGNPGASTRFHGDNRSWTMVSFFFFIYQFTLTYTPYVYSNIHNLISLSTAHMQHKYVQ
jgi:hypothetical protein